ncbi:class I adenylate-forming enzyme family protein [Haladaptatus sp. CMSO5]|uniref:class I adenylate-forming enzyme family protein n=1 Tax=Haladaptatus sp. CMSO5 TaxID=3120514 RepID=UPI002FCE0634
MNWVVNLENQVHERGRKTAVISEGESYTYNELNWHANSFANWLKSFGGKRVCMYVPNTPEVYFAAFGAMKAGGAPAPINYMFGRNIIEYVLDDADADAVMTFPDDAEMVASAAKDAGVEHVVTIGESEYGTITLDEILTTHSNYTETVPQRDDDLFGLMYTSGTTGNPKGVYKSHRSVSVHTKAMRHIWKITSDQTWLCAGPLYHTSGFESSSLPVLAAGGTVVLHKWDIDRFLAEVEQYKADSAYIAGSMLLDMLEYETPERYDVSSLKQVFAGGAPMDAKDYDTVEEMYDVRVSERLGMTEAGIILTYPVGKTGEFSPRDEVPGRVPGSCGRPVVQEVDVRVVDLNTGEVVEVGEGEMQVRGDTLFEKYINKPEKTKEAFTEDGWYQSGDVVRVDEDGYIFHLRRADSMIVTGGENVYPRGVERVISSHDAVKETAVFPIPDAHWGERVCAAVVLKDGASVTEAELIQFCKQSDDISDFEAPKQIFFRDSLPKTPTKSIRRPDLTDEYRDVPYEN